MTSLPLVCKPDVDILAKRENKKRKKILRYHIISKLSQPVTHTNPITRTQRYLVNADGYG